MNKLPVEMLSIIFNYVIINDIKDLINIVLVNREFYHIIQNDKYDLIWRDILSAYLKTPVDIKNEPDLVNTICKVYNIVKEQITPCILFKYIYQIRYFEECCDPNKYCNGYCGRTISYYDVKNKIDLDFEKILYYENVNIDRHDIINISLLPNIYTICIDCHPDNLPIINNDNKDTKDVKIIKYDDIKVHIKNDGKLKNITKLYVNWDCNFSIDEGALPNMYRLYCSIHNITNEPINDIIKLTSLTQLCISDCYVSQDTLIKISTMYNLHKLFLDNNDIITLPKQFENLKNINTLSITKNKLKDIPKCIFNMGKIYYLILNNNSISYISINIYKLSNLMYLEIVSNPVTDLPEELSELTKLEMIKIDMTNLRSYPFVINNIKSLKYIYNRRNNIKIHTSGLLNRIIQVDE